MGKRKLVVVVRGCQVVTGFLHVSVECCR